MSLIRCPECKKRISENASACPHCGNRLTLEKTAEIKRKEEQGKKVGGIACLVIIALIVGYWVVNPSKPKTQDELRQMRIERQFSGLDSSHIKLTERIKNHMNDPDSFEHVKTAYVDKGDYLIVTEDFRGKNAFGGVIKNSVTAKVDLDGDILEIISQSPSPSPSP